MWERQNALKCKEKIGLKSESRNCEKTKLFLTYHLRYFLFKLLWKFKCVTFFNHKNYLTWAWGYCPLPKHPFFNAKNFWAYKYTLYGTSINSKNINLQSFAIFSETNFWKISWKKWFNQGMWLAFKELLKMWGSIIRGCLHRGPN